MSEGVVTVHADRGDPLLGFINPLAPLRTCWKHRELLRQLSRREVIGRYRGSHLGVLWALLTPLMTLSVFTLVFGTIHQNRWNASGAGSRLEFPMNLFIGIIMFGVFSEVASRAATLITSNPNFVKKAVFPLELIGVSVLFGSIVHATMTLLIELMVVWIALGHIPATALLLPLVFIPAGLLALGTCWLLGALGVFFRDLGNAVGPLVQLVFFLTPIVYPIRVFNDHPLAGRLLWWLNPFVAIALALADILLLLALVLATTIAFFRRDRAAGALMVPYLAWVAFATLLTAAIFRLNPV